MKIRCALSLLIFLISSFMSGAVDRPQDLQTEAPDRFLLKFGSFSKEYDVVAPLGNSTI